MQEHETVLHELVELGDRLAGLPEDAYEERAALRARQTELRQRAAELRVTAELASNEEELRSELKRLEELLTRIISEDHIRVVPATEGGGPGGFVGDAMKINRLIDSARDRGEIEERIRILRDHLERID